EANPGDPALCLSIPTCGPGGEDATYILPGGATQRGTRGPFGGNFSSEGYFITIGKSSYNSVQLTLRQRLKDLQLLAGYTYSKSLDNSSGYGEQINFLNQGARALSSFDMRHNFVVSYDYQLPVNRLGGPRRLVDGW